MIQSATAPDKMRIKVKLAASIVVRFSANRQSRELPANAIIASKVRMKTRIRSSLNTQTQTRNFILDPVSLKLCRVFRLRYRSEEHTSELQSLTNLVCRLL